MVNNINLNISNVEVRMYTDDTSVIVNREDLADFSSKTSVFVEEATIWWAKNGMILNVSHELTV